MQQAHMAACAASNVLQTTEAHRLLPPPMLHPPILLELTLRNSRFHDIAWLLAMKRTGEA